MVKDSCAHQEGNKKDCPCTYTNCTRHGACCECVKYHRGKDQLPACFFTAEEEKTYNRNIDYFIECRTK
ncbi:DUF6485 family protein [Maridesulfovibrio hydrothermalis]|uniref:Cytosolic protein n=1 Tax=Maridesulfovibrio hydrothermalis AM13 = DSM 14728 TaxID=1121451 RepID=L0REH2_9BACT|nr:DUF6485 family protein [Maridesulfovibrio hydrothermalis]CCO24590.1 conserved protein of unknown function [Maridesulfovibrio hydrothermalis AM13 = DSM 14728]